MYGEYIMKDKNIIIKDPYQVYLTLGVVISGTAHDLEVFLADIKSHKNLKLIYTKTTAGRLELVEQTEQNPSRKNFKY